MPEILQTTMDVKVDGATYTFKIPDIRMRFEIAARAAEIRRRAVPNGAPVDSQEPDAIYFSRECAILELYLVKSTESWVYGEESPEKIDITNPPTVDFMRFPDDKGTIVSQIAGGFDAELTRFRQSRNSNKRPTGGEVVASGENPGAS